MNRIEKAITSLALVSVLIFIFVIIMFLVACFNLYRFNQCYNNSFKLAYCENYKDY